VRLRFGMNGFFEQEPICVNGENSARLPFKSFKEFRGWRCRWCMRPTWPVQTVGNDSHECNVDWDAEGLFVRVTEPHACDMARIHGDAQ
jgi:hypothetical protein